MHWNKDDCGVDHASLREPPIASTSFAVSRGGGRFGFALADPSSLKVCHAHDHGTARIKGQSLKCPPSIESSYLIIDRSIRTPAPMKVSPRAPGPAPEKLRTRALLPPLWAGT